MLIAQVKGATDSTAPTTLREKDVRRAEKVLAKLRLLDEAAGAHGDARAFDALAHELYPGLFVTVADMRESDLKTDLDTAVFLYEGVIRARPAVGALTVNCAEQRRDIYLPLCLGLRSGTVREFNLAKARLHTRWGAAVVNYYRAERGADTSRAISAMNAAREHDSVIAARALEMLKSLGSEVHTFPTRADYEERGVLTKIGFDQLEAKFDDDLRHTGTLIASMPRSPTFYLLLAAWRSYKDGAFWYRKVYQSRKLVVSANGFDQDSLKDLKLDADMVGHTVVIHWRKAKDYTSRAEEFLSRATAPPGLNPNEVRPVVRGL